MVMGWLWMGCWAPLPPCPACALNDDIDEDGFSPNQGDCDDASAAVRPGAEERCNGVDDDCDGTIDVGATDATPVWRDGDGDGFGTGGPEVGCVADGWAPEPGDCDDTAPLVNPGVPEVCNDQVDNDCSGGPDDCEATGAWSLDEADARIAYASNGAALGTSLAASAAGLLVGAPGVGLLGTGVVFRYAPRASWTDLSADLDSDATLQGSTGTSIGTTLATLPTSTGPNWVIREERLIDTRGFVHQVAGAVSGDRELTEVAQATWEGGTDGRIGDLLAAGSDGLLVTTENAAVAAWWLPTSGSGDVTQQGVQIGGAAPSALAVGDLDGDGTDDVVVGRGLAGDDLLNVRTGAVYVFFGPVIADTTLDEADVILFGSSINQQIGSGLAIVPDLDGDGIHELAIAGPSGNAGAVWIVTGPPVPGVVEARAWLTLDGLANTGVGSAIVPLDLNADGHIDMAIGAPAEDETGDDAGVVFVEHGPFIGGTRTLDDAALILTGVGATSRAGTALATADIDLNGVSDLIVGAPGASDLAVGGGSVYVWLGGGL